MGNNKFLSARNNIEELLSQKEKIIESAGNEVAKVMIDFNTSGETDVKRIRADIKKLIAGFSVEESNRILVFAMAKVIANI